MMQHRRRFRLSRFAAHMLRAACDRTRPATADHLYRRIGPEQLAATFVGHATVLLQWLGANVLTDPNFVRRVLVPKRLVEPGIAIQQLPPLEAIVISHAHFDHLVKPSLRQLPKDVPVVVPAGLAELIAPLGFRRVHELHWWEAYEADGLKIVLVPAKHWGRRTPRDRERGYGGFVIERRGHHAYFAGDTAYFKGFAEIGRAFPIDLALLPIGAYRPPSFRQVHCDPEDALRAFDDLRARYLVPIHWGTFRLSYEPVEEPIAWLARLSAERGYDGRVNILQHGQTFVVPRGVAAGDSACEARCWQPRPGRWRGWWPALRRRAAWASTHDVDLGEIDHLPALADLLRHDQDLLMDGGDLARGDGQVVVEQDLAAFGLRAGQAELDVRAGVGEVAAAAQGRHHAQLFAEPFAGQSSRVFQRLRLVDLHVVGLHEAVRHGLGAIAA
jgi:L-ascorbate metabolism protein UlaG (beta-lactamase superfamily)